MRCINIYDLLNIMRMSLQGESREITLSDLEPEEVLSVYGVRPQNSAAGESGGIYGSFQGGVMPDYCTLCDGGGDIV